MLSVMVMSKSVTAFPGVSSVVARIPPRPSLSTREQSLTVAS